jgi:hypothetical protein
VYTLLVTSCGRHDLLKRTLDSFIAAADVAPLETIVYEDGSSPKPSWLDPSVIWLSEGLRRGQTHAIEALYEAAHTEYVFHCEDDWEFVEPGFVAKSLAILEQYPRVYTVTLRKDWNPPLTSDPDFPGLQIAEPYWGGCWGGCSWNPGMRRKSDFVGFGGYGRFNDEAALSKYLLNKNYRMATLPSHCVHLGEGRHVC